MTPANAELRKNSEAVDLVSSSGNPKPLTEISKPLGYFISRHYQPAAGKDDKIRPPQIYSILFPSHYLHTLLVTDSLSLFSLPHYR